MHDDVNAATSGAIGGVLATVAMSVPMMAAQRIGLLGEPPPDRVSETVLDSIGIRGEPKWAHGLTAGLLHFAFGAASGACFGVLYRHTPLRRAPSVQGVVFATAIWFVSYMGWVPAVGILPPAHQDRRDRVVVMVIAHWIYGAVLGAVAGRHGPGPREQSRTGA